VIWCYILWRDGPPPGGPGPPHYRGYAITLRHTTIGRTPLNEWSARRRDLYLTTPHSHNRKSPSQEEFGPSIPVRDKPQTHALERALSRTGHLTWHCSIWNTNASLNTKEGKKSATLSHSFNFFYILSFRVYFSSHQVLLPICTSIATLYIVVSQIFGCVTKVCYVCVCLTQLCLLAAC
jgi:hypothetical protein